MLILKDTAPLRDADPLNKEMWCADVEGGAPLPESTYYRIRKAILEHREAMKLHLPLRVQVELSDLASYVLVDVVIARQKHVGKPEDEVGKLVGAAADSACLKYRREIGRESKGNMKTEAVSMIKPPRPDGEDDNAAEFDEQAPDEVTLRRPDASRADGKGRKPDLQKYRPWAIHVLRVMTPEARTMSLYELKHDVKALLRGLKRPGSMVDTDARHRVAMDALLAHAYCDYDAAVSIIMERWLGRRGLILEDRQACNVLFDLTLLLEAELVAGDYVPLGKSIARDFVSGLGRFSFVDDDGNFLHRLTFTVVKEDMPERNIFLTTPSRMAWYAAKRKGITTAKMLEKREKKAAKGKAKSAVGGPTPPSDPNRNFFRTRREGVEYWDALEAAAVVMDGKDRPEAKCFLSRMAGRVYYHRRYGQAAMVLMAHATQGVPDSMFNLKMAHRKLRKPKVLTSPKTAAFQPEQEGVAA